MGISFAIYAKHFVVENIKCNCAKLNQRSTIAAGAASQKFHDGVFHNPEVDFVEIERLRLNFLLAKICIIN